MVRALPSFASVKLVVVDGVREHDVDDDGCAGAAKAHEAQSEAEGHGAGGEKGEVRDHTADGDNHDRHTVCLQLAVLGHLRGQ